LGNIHLGGGDAVRRAPPGGALGYGRMEQPIWSDFAALALTVALVLVICL
jgi:hypothetical protein